MLISGIARRRRGGPGPGVSGGLTLLAVVVAGSLSLPTLAPAQRIGSPYRFVEHKQDLGAFASYISTDRGNANLGPKSGVLYGLRYALRLSDPLRLSAFAAYFPAERDVVDPTTDDGPLVLGVEDLNVLLLAGQLHLVLTGTRTWHNIAPYVIAGLGIAIDLTGEPSCTADSTRPQCQVAVRERFEFGSSVMGTFGLGLIWMPSGRLGARLAVTDDIWRLRAPGEFFDLGLAPETAWTNNIELSGGLSLWF